MKKLFCTLLLIATLGLGTANASHLMGGEITYFHQIGNDYVFNLTLYRDCGGVAFPSSPMLTISSANLSTTYTPTMFATGVFEISNLCSAQFLNSACIGGALMGIERQTYTTTVTLTGNANDWVIIYDDCCRNAAITNLDNPASYGLRLESKLNNLNGVNSSPEFANPPVMILSQNVTQNITWTAYDVDGDQLVYTLTAPYDNSGNPIPYAAGFSAQQPFQNFQSTTLDSLTGVMSVSPSTLQIGVVSMIMDEYRNGDWIGSVRRDLQLAVLNSSNSLPTLSGFGGMIWYEAWICPDSLFEYTIESDDGDTAQILTMTWDSSLAGASFTVSGGNQPVGIFSWEANQSMIGETKIFTVTVKDDNCDYNGIQTYAYVIHVDSCGPFVDYVWPGDANDDGFVDNTDLFPIGLAYGFVGYARDSVSINWEAKNCNDWIDTFSFGGNYKHADCNGDSIILADDTAAILLNFGYSHPQREAEGAQGGNAPLLTIELPTDTFDDGDTITATLLLGDMNLQANDVYGLAFTFNYDVQVVDSSFVQLEFSDSWLCDLADCISINHEDYGNGQLQIGLTRIDQQSRSGYGEIGTIKMKITTDNINGKDDLYYFLNAFINNVTMIDEEGNELQTNAGGDSVAVHYEETSINELDEGLIQIYPNPSDNYIVIENITHPSSLIGIEIFNPAGSVAERMIKPVMTDGKLIINISDLTDGIYFIKLRFENGNILKRFVKTK